MDDLTTPPNPIRSLNTGAMNTGAMNTRAPEAGSVPDCATAGAGALTHLSPNARRVLDDVESYWQDLSRAKRIPFRSEVDPNRIDIALPHAFILQRVAHGTGRFRVAGSRIEKLLGLDPRGMPLTAMFTPAGRTVVQHWFAEVFDRPALVELPLMSARGIGRPKLTGGMIMLPLAAEDGTVSLAMGAMITEGEVGRGTRRFDVPDGDIRISPVGTDPEAPRRRPALSQKAQQLVTQIDAISDGIPQNVEQKSKLDQPYLRLVVDNS